MEIPRFSEGFPGAGIAEGRFLFFITNVVVTPLG
jgi:hypothetical protein